MEVDDFIQYPREVATSLVTVSVSVSNLSFSYPFRNFWDLKSDLENISFCVLQAVGGSAMNYSLYCHRHLLATSTFTLSDIEIFPVGWSRLSPNYDLVGKFQDICFDNSTRLVFFSQPKTEFNLIQLSSNRTMDVIIHDWSLERYRKDVCGELERRPSLFVSVSANSTSRILSDVILPLFGAFYHSFNRNDYLIVLIDRETQSHLVPSLIPLLKNEIQWIQPNACYTMALFVRSPGSVPPQSNHTFSDFDGIVDHMEYIYRFGDPVLAKLSSFFGRSVSIIRGKVAVDPIFAGFVEEWQKNCSQCNFMVLNESLAVPEMAEVVASSNLLISGGLYTNLYAPLLSVNATLIEIPQDGAECTRFGMRFAGQRYVAHYAVNGVCECDIRCYLSREKRYEHVYHHTVVNSIHGGISKVV
jgi:hypothetical protein